MITQFYLRVNLKMLVVLELNEDNRITERNCTIFNYSTFML